MILKKQTHVIISIQERNMKILMKIENVGDIELELYPEKAPITAENFAKLTKEGFYDGTVFHRVIDGFVIQGGDPTGTGMGGPGYTIKGEFNASETT